MAAGRGTETLRGAGLPEPESSNRENLRSFRHPEPACSCTFANYEVSSEQQRKAFTMAKSYAQNFGNGFASFVFSGGPGTGKNHLAAGIGNYLLTTGHRFWSSPAGSDALGTRMPRRRSVRGVATG